MARDRFLSECGDSGDVILLAGAGSSCHLGLPALDELMRQASLENDEVADRIRDTQKAVQANRGRFSSAVFEELIARIRYYIEVAEMIRTDHVFKQTMQQVPWDIGNGVVGWKWKESLTRCYRVLLNEYGPQQIHPDQRPFEVTLELLDGLQRLNGASLHVYTTNYDCSFQVLASNCSEVAFYTHIDEVKGRFTDFWHPANPALPRDLPLIFVHRLHGCIGWFNETDPGGGAGFTHEVFGAGSKLEIKDDDMLHRMCIKLIATDLMGYNKVFASAFDEFETHLRSAKVLLIWGYSFRDLEVARAINQAFSQRSTPLKILYIDPYLPPASAKNNILSCLRRALVSYSAEFVPQRVPWTNPHNVNSLVPTVLESVGQGVSDYGE